VGKNIQNNIITVNEAVTCSWIWRETKSGKSTDWVYWHRFSTV